MPGLSQRSTRAARAWSAAVACAVLILGACATSQPAPSGNADRGYGKSAEDDYKSGLDELKSHNYPDATRFFEHVRSKYPFSKYAALSELRLADVKFEGERYLESADAYQQFLRLHPAHEQADYAAFRVALSHWKDAPGDFVLFPPSYEKDQAQIHEAVKSLDDFVRKYPGSTYRPEAERMLAQARGKLAEHEWYVAEFYAKRERWAGAAGRFEAIVKDYPDSPREPAALYRLAEVYLKLKETPRARQALEQLIEKHPTDPRRHDAERLLASLR